MNPNLYKNLNIENVMEVEKELGKLENKCSNIINNIIKSNEYIEIKENDLNELKKFLFIMIYFFHLSRIILLKNKVLLGISITDGKKFPLILKYKTYIFNYYDSLLNKKISK